MTRVLLTRVGCRYTCSFCAAPKPYEGHFADYSGDRNFRTLAAEVDSAPADCDVFVLTGCDCNEDLALTFDVIAYIRRRRGDAVHIGIQSHCAELQDPEIVQRLVSLGVGGVYVPVYGATPEVHSTVMTPKPGVVLRGFPQMDAIDNCLAAGIRVFVRTAIAESNKDDATNVIDQVLALAFKHGRAITYSVMPVYYLTGRNENYVPFKDLAPSLRRIQQHLSWLGGVGGYLEHEFDGFPFCLFDGRDPGMRNGDFLEYLLRDYVAEGGNQLPSASKVYSAVDPRIPSYRIRVQPPICAECRYKGECAGFPQLDYEAFGTGTLQPYREGS